MVVVSGHTFGSTLEIGKIYYFKSNQLKHTSQPHYFIVIATPSDDLIIFTCCTSQFEKRARFIELANIPMSTLVWIKPNDENSLVKDSYVDCNSCFQYSKSELIKMYEVNQIDFIGYILESQLEEIRQGINDSPLIVKEMKELILSNKTNP